jgi:GDPmannose 4,6-dehydratase
LFECNGILFNHESPLRGETFVTRKITRGLARIKLGLEDTLHLGNLDAKRDWGHAKDYVVAQWLVLQQDKPEDFCIATGEQHSVREFVNLAAHKLDIKINWSGNGVSEIGKDSSGNEIIKVDPRYFRRTEVDTLLGDPSKAKQKLGWECKISFDQLVTEMVEEDLALAQRDAMIKEKGYKTFDYKE